MEKDSLTQRKNYPRNEEEIFKEKKSLEDE